MRPHRLHPRRAPADRFTGSAARRPWRAWPVRTSAARPRPPTQFGAVRAVHGVRGRGAWATASCRWVPTNPESVAPDVIRALVASGADIVEVRPEQASLERVYFEIMGVDAGRRQRSRTTSDAPVDRLDRPAAGVVRRPSATVS